MKKLYYVLLVLFLAFPSVSFSQEEIVMKISQKQFEDLEINYNSLKNQNNKLSEIAKNLMTQLSESKNETDTISIYWRNSQEKLEIVEKSLQNSEVKNRQLQEALKISQVEQQSQLTTVQTLKLDLQNSQDLLQVSEQYLKKLETQIKQRQNDIYIYSGIALLLGYLIGNL